MEVGLHYFAHAGNFAHVERGEKLRLLAGNDPEDAIRLGLPGAHFRDQARGSDPDRTVQPGLGFHAVMELMRSSQRRAVQALGTAHVEIGFVDRRHFDLRRKSAEHFVNLFGTLAVALGMSVDEDGVRALLGCGAQRHGGMDSELAGFVGSGGDHSTLVALPANDNGFAFQRRIVEFLDRDEEGVHIDVEDGARERGLLGGSHAWRILAGGGCRAVTFT